MTEHTEDRLKTIRKWISALLEKTTGNNVTEGEAVSAAEKAAELMRKYDISMVELGRDGAFIPNSLTVSVHPAFHDQLIRVLISIGDLCSTRMLSEHGDVVTVTIVGEEQDAVMGRFLMTVCSLAVVGETAKAVAGWALYRKNVRHRKRLSFVEGMTKRLSHRIDELARERHDGTGSALVPSKFARIDDWLDERYDLVSRGPRDTIIDPEAYKLGRKAADRVPLRQTIAGEQEPVNDAA